MILFCKSHSLKGWVLNLLIRLLRNINLNLSQINLSELVVQAVSETEEDFKKAKLEIDFREMNGKMYFNLLVSPNGDNLYVLDITNGEEVTYRILNKK